MPRQVIIVESPNKAKTIRQLVGGQFEVLATVGHFCDLPLKEMGVDVANGFKPTYVYDPDKKDVVAKLKALKQQYPAADILVASDADREGEAIGWHIARTIGLKPAEVRRVAFHEITQDGIRRSLNEVRPLDLGLVAAQEARRILDRLVGYSLTPVLRDRLPAEQGLSAGRVQSVALRVVVDREIAIRAFTPREYWSLHAHYAWPGEAGRMWESELIGTGAPGKTKALVLDDEAAAQALLKALNVPHLITKIIRKEAQRKPSAPFITSTMLQKASSRLRMSTDETTKLAKLLFERGLVTYIRTDEPSVSPEFQKETLSYLKDRYGAQVLPARPNSYKAKGLANAQGAHECIRPTSLDNERPDALDERALALYRLIRETYLASQCKAARFDVTEIFMQAGEYVLKAGGRILIDPGFLVILQAQDDDENETQGKVLPALQEGETHLPQRIEPRQHFTKAPERFSEATLIQYLEEKGIGRPSTYNAMVAKIRERQFVETINKRFLKPTPKGELLDTEIRACFAPVINESFTAELEGHLDKIACREEEWRVFMDHFWQAFTPLLAAARQGVSRRYQSNQAPAAGKPAANQVLGPPCYRCGEPMKLVVSRQAFRCSADACNTWLDQALHLQATKGKTPPCPTCKGPTRPIEGKGYGCMKWRRDASEGSCSGWVKWEAWAQPKKPSGKAGGAPKKPPVAKKPTPKKKPPTP